MRPVTAAVGSSSLTSLVIALARDFIWSNPQGGVLGFPAPDACPSLTELLPVSTTWTLDWTSVLVGIFIGLCLGPALDLILLLRVAWSRLIQQSLRGGAARQLYRILA